MHWPSWEPCVDQVVDDSEIGEIEGQQWDLLHGRGRRDREVELASTRLAATLCGCRREPPPGASDLYGNRHRIEGRFDDRQSMDPAGALVVVAGKQRPEMQLCETRPMFLPEPSTAARYGPTSRPQRLMEYFVGPLYVRLLITEEPVDDAFVESVIEIGLSGSAIARARPGVMTPMATGTSLTSIPEGRTVDSR